MPSISFALEPAGPKRVTVSWRIFWRDVSVTLDGEEVLKIADQKALRAGASRTLADGSTLSIKLEQRFMTPELVLSRNGTPLPGSATDPATRVKAALGVLLFIGGASIIGGLIAEVFHVEWLKAIGLGVGSIVEGCVYAALAFFVKRGSRVALGVGIGLFLLDSIAAVVVLANSSVSPVGALFARAIFVAVLVRGYAAMAKPKSNAQPSIAS